jgi:hypothetical protein
MQRSGKRSLLTRNGTRLRVMTAPREVFTSVQQLFDIPGATVTELKKWRLLVFYIAVF